ncbi:MAG: hypothetical protein ACPG77_21095, partial [Nannocystaceae bacterium]
MLPRTKKVPSSPTGTAERSTDLACRAIHRPLTSGRLRSSPPSYAGRTPTLCRLSYVAAER